MSLTKPRYETAQSGLPGDPLFWETVLNQSDVFAYNTASEGKGGPFGAQLWLVHPDTDQYILVGTAQEPEDSNAVISKGRASAHAEAENLSLEKRQELVNFLEAHRGEGWKIVQVSSGESCPSCRSKQVLLASELIERGAIGPNDFHVAFKATYDQTKRDAGFNDAPYDQAMRAINKLDVLKTEQGLFGLSAALKADKVASAQIDTGELVYNPVDLVTKADAPKKVVRLFEWVGKQPFAVIIGRDGEIMSGGMDERYFSPTKINQPEKTAIVNALYKAAAKLRDVDGKFEAWNLEGAHLYTNIANIGPVAYAESLWYNLSDIRVVEEYTCDVIERAAQEMPGIDNKILFAKAAADYDAEDSPLKVVFNGDPEGASVAHLYWKAKMAMEGLKNRQAERLNELEQNSGITQIAYIDGTEGALSDLVQSSSLNSHYDGKQADPAPV